MTQAPIPSPPAFLLSLCMGLFVGLGSGLILMLGVQTSWRAALFLTVIAVVFGTVRHVLGWILVMLPIRVAQALWRLASGAPEPPEIPVKRHWMTPAAFWAGLTLTSLLMLHAAFQEKVS